MRIVVLPCMHEMSEHCYSPSTIPGAVLLLAKLSICNFHREIELNYPQVQFIVKIITYFGVPVSTPRCIIMPFQLINMESILMPIGTDNQRCKIFSMWRFRFFADGPKIIHVIY